MKTLRKGIMLLTSFVMAVSAASCVNNELTEPEDGKAVKELATIDEQITSMEATVAGLEALQTSAEGLDAELAEVVSSIENHVADLKAGASLLDGTLATLSLQKELAGVMAAIESDASTKGGEALTKAVASVDKAAASWLGKHFGSYYPAAKAEAAAAARLASLDLKTPQLHVEAILSDVEAGLRKDADKDELTALAASVNANIAEAEELAATLSATVAEVEDEYTDAVETAVTDPSGFDLPALRQFNSAVAATLSEADNSLAGLIARVAACEAQLDNIKNRLSILEEGIKDYASLLDLIQSVTFMSEFSEEKAVAEYDLGTEKNDEGNNIRTPHEAISLSYVVRPASAAAALAEESLRNNGLKVIGYYASAITKAASEMKEFSITGVTADATGGIVNLTVSSSSLSEDFYYKKIGAKIALSIVSGNTDLTSKFVEIVPKDASGKKYLESIRLSEENISLDAGQTAPISATLAPDDAYDKGITWTSSDGTIATVVNGVITTYRHGEVTLTATTSGTDEWGNPLTASCKVTVNPNVKIFGPASVDAGVSVPLRVEGPAYISPELLTWSIPSTTNPYASVDQNGVVTGRGLYFADGAYLPVKVSCYVGGEYNLTLTHEIRIVAPQPQAIEIGQTQLTCKPGEGFSLDASVIPSTVDIGAFSGSGTNFRWRYQSWDSSVAEVNESGYVSAKSPGTTAIVVEIQTSSSANYYYPSDRKVSKNVTVTVLPWYVTGITLTESGKTIESNSTFNLPAGNSTKITATLTSDGGDGNDPTYKDLVWSSSAPDVVSVDQDGNIKAADGANGKTATITVKTATAGATADGNPIIVQFTVNVAAAGYAFEVGDYVVRKTDGSIAFASDLATAQDQGTVVGVVFAKTNPRSTDTRLPESCVNGLAIGLNEIAACKWWSGASSDSTVPKVDTYAIKNGFSSVTGTSTNWQGMTITSSGNALLGYNNTEAFKAFINAGYTTSTLIDGLSNYSVARPDNVSPWYLPSLKEMILIGECDRDNSLGTLISAAGGASFASEYYWTVSEENNMNDNADAYHMGDRSYTYRTKTTNNYKSRVIFAF